MSEVGGAKPKVSPTGKSSSEFDVFALSRFAYASRDVRDVHGVPCVRRRARQINGVRVQSGGGSQIFFPWLGRFRENVLLLLLLLSSRPTSIGHSDVISLVFVHISNEKSTIPIGHGLDMGTFC